ncbi:sporulation protein YqfD [Alicyclobacillus cycloheptanicus]|uniref:Stage IV sporulation protein n=1 Tax=Alicyclobacillus cycloheptanicus TaxID=1457 RepID=A0ABT9XJK4_9BACL|nr:sporulation protein YqfD [Alicyclobacillus cycloheptanicus]MDQ0190476.1 hypothetical protein [Alicyclobacillus cycloheptanicus]WDM00761.1 sporulation protein YqfD [Alicyclobacillus cycloheptanicus]
MMARPGLWWFGSLHVELRGPGASAVIRELQRAGVALYEVRVGSRTCNLVISLQDFPALYRVCRQNGVKLRFLEKSGAPFFARALLRRKFLLLGLGLFVALVFLWSSMIWQVTVSGVEGEDVQAVVQAARDSGLYVGAWKRNIPDVNAVQQEMLAKLPDAIWVGVQIEGTKAQVKVVEKIPGVTERSEQPHSILVAKPGVIRRVIATRGQVLVHPGQAVQPGQVAISGSLGQGTHQVAASGKVLAEVWYQSKVQIPLQIQQNELTGESVTRTYLDIFGLSVRIWGWAEPRYPSAVERDEVTSWDIGDWVLPIQLKRVQVQQAQQTAYVRSLDEAQQEAVRMAAQDVRRQMQPGGVILGQRVLQRQVSRGKLYATILTRTEEDIGTAGPVASPSEPGDDST